MNKPYRHILLDRDGVLVRNRPDYVKSWSEVELLPTALRALALLTERGHQLTVVTNQSAIGRGIVKREVVDGIHQGLDAVIEEAGGKITSYYMCPHRPEEGCLCRKPLPGLVHQAAVEHDIELSRAVLIGDQFTDVQTAIAAGCNSILLTGVLTGVHPLGFPTASRAHTLAPNLLEAAQLIKDMPG